MKLLRKVPKIAPERATVFTPSKTNVEFWQAETRSATAKTLKENITKLLSTVKSLANRELTARVNPDSLGYRVRGTDCVPPELTSDPC